MDGNPNPFFSPTRSWQQTVTREKNGKNELVVFKRPCIINIIDGVRVVVTVQAKAWADTVGACMLQSLILGPYVQSIGSDNAQWIQDNCAVHRSGLWPRPWASPCRSWRRTRQVADVTSIKPLKAAISQRLLATRVASVAAWLAVPANIRGPLTFADINHANVVQAVIEERLRLNSSDTRVAAIKRTFVMLGQMVGTKLSAGSSPRPASHAKCQPEPP